MHKNQKIDGFRMLSIQDKELEDETRRSDELEINTQVGARLEVWWCESEVGLMVVVICERWEEVVEKVRWGEVRRNGKKREYATGGSMGLYALKEGRSKFVSG